MCALDKTERDKLAFMFEGDKLRDASSNIRGFLFQDYVAIKCLLQKEVEYVCSEYLEDVNAFTENTLALIQVKYYPKTALKMKPIATDLYYQFLRLRMLRSKLTPAPRLCIHGNAYITKPNLQDMKGYLGLGNKLKEKAVYPDAADVEDWMKKNVYFKEEGGKQKKRNKDEQKAGLFAQMAAEDSLKEFLAAFDVVNLKNIETYKNQLMQELSDEYPNPDQDRDEEHWQMILLGLAVTFVQRRYMLDDPTFEKMRVDKNVFDRYIEEATQTEEEETIANYLVGVATQRYGEIIEYNLLEDLQAVMLNRIYRNTIPWIKEISKDTDGQYRLLNTLSRQDSRKVAQFKRKTPNGRLCAMAECSVDFGFFLSYLWKIMLDIGQQHVEDQDDIQNHPELFDPKHYIDSSVKEYVCLHFPEDYAAHSVILPSVCADPRTVAYKIIDRIVSMEEHVPKPEKWFFQNFANNEIMRGKYDYDLNVAAIKENQTIVDMADEGFYIECMNCIDITAGGWSKRENCKECIFSEECVEKGR